MMGFFSSGALASLAPGLATYINNGGDAFRLIVSPYLRNEDQLAIAEGLKTAEAVAETLIESLLVTEDELQQHTLRCLSYLLRAGRIEMKVALLKDALFHAKVWMFSNDTDVLAAHGSSNLTVAGITKNFEQITVSRSWQDANQRYVVEKLTHKFERLWEDKEEECAVVPLPRALKERLVLTYGTEVPPGEPDFLALYSKAMQGKGSPLATRKPIDVVPPEFGIPEWLNYETGPFEHQGKAVDAWCQASYCGVLEMATGSGKTITAMIGAHRLCEAKKALLIVIAAPYVPLIQQWCDEIEPFGLKPVNLTTAGGASERSKILSQVKRRLRLGISRAEAVVVSHDTLCSTEFHSALESSPCAQLLIADEVHNLGRVAFIERPPNFFENRLGLSATPIRQYDPEGTHELLEYFGPVVFRFTLKEAIGRCLVEYDYYVHPVYLDDDEMERWHELTATIKQNAWRQNDENGGEYLAKLLRDRRVILETARGKIALLRKLIDAEDVRSLKHTLIYTTDKQPDQLRRVNQVLREKGILFHQLTATETADRDGTRRIINGFQEGEIQVLTAKRVLDEGVNIPQICKAYILASTTVERQWVQRRGRLLRTCPAINKTHSEVHDLIALPPGIESGLEDDARSIVRSELRRAQEFAGLARNAGRPNGPLSLLARLVDAAHV